jgi:hypothetical protein
MSTMKNAPGIQHKALTDLSHGFATNPPAGLTHLAAGGKVSTVAEVLSELQGYVAVYKTADEAAIAYEKALLARDAVAATVNARFDEIRAAIKAALGRKNPELAVFGLAPDQTPAPLTVEQKLVRAAKAKATRAARHTMGPKQKKAIKGQVTPAAGQSPAVV